MQHVAVHHGHAGQQNLIIVEAQLFGQVPVNLIQQLLAAQIRQRIQQSNAEAGLLVLL